MNPKPDSPLRDLLDSWSVHPRPDPAFRAVVWTRIEARRRARWSAYLRRHALAGAVALVLAVVTGGWVGSWQGQRATDRARAQLAAEYLSTLDPRAPDEAGQP